MVNCDLLCYLARCRHQKADAPYKTERAPGIMHLIASVTDYRHRVTLGFSANLMHVCQFVRSAVGYDIVYAIFLADIPHHCAGAY